MKSAKTLLCFLMLNFIYPLLAANQIVTNNNDSGAGSLRQAISDASIGDEITFNLAAGNETIVLTSNTLLIPMTLIIDGSNLLGSGTQIAIDGDDTHRVLDITAGLVSLKNMTIQNGNSPDGGGGIHNSIEDMSLTINNCQIINNTGGHDYTGGGGICNEGIIDIISNTTFSGNYSEKYGAGIYNRGTIIGISKCTINDNIISSENGGGLYNDTDGMIYTIDNSTISGNKYAYNGGGLYNSGEIHEILFCTIANNAAENYGGGIYLYGGKIAIKNSIIANNTALSGSDYYFSTLSPNMLTDNGYNIVENSNTPPTAAGFDNINTILYNTIYNNVTTSNTTWTKGGTVLSNQNLSLSATLADNGGQTKTLAVNAGSFAIGSGFYNFDLSTDQRNVSRVNPPTIGAYEMNQAVTFTDGSAYSPAPVPGQTNQPIGRFALQAAGNGSVLTGANMKLNNTRSGVTNFKLWASADADFNTGSDTQLGSTVAADPGDGNSASFSDFSSSIGTSAGYFFLTCDIASDAEGSIKGVVAGNASLSVIGGEISGTLTNEPLSDGDTPLPVNLGLFTASQEGISVILDWTTESEINNLGFILHRSEDNVQWLKIASYKTCAELKGQGYSSTRTTYCYIDKKVTLETGYYYRISDVNVSGETRTYDPIFIQLAKLPNETCLGKPYPNPFNPQTFISYKLKNETLVNISVYDMLGRLVKVLYNDNQAAGYYNVFWNGTDENCQQACSGTYIICMQTDDKRQIQKVLYLK